MVKSALDTYVTSTPPEKVLRIFLQQMNVNFFLPGLIQNRILVQSRIPKNLKVLNLHHWFTFQHA
jgi:hypothetical protein